MGNGSIRCQRSLCWCKRPGLGGPIRLQRTRRFFCVTAEKFLIFFFQREECALTSPENMKQHLKPILPRARFAIASAFLLLGATLFSVALTTTAASGGKGTVVPNATADAFANGPSIDTTSVIVQLKGDPLSTNHTTKPLAGKKIDFNSNAVKTYRAQLAAKRADFTR